MKTKIILTFLVGLLLIGFVFGADIISSFTRDKVVPIEDAVEYKTMGLTDFKITKNEKITYWEVCFFKENVVNTCNQVSKTKEVCVEETPKEGIGEIMGEIIGEGEEPIEEAPVEPVIVCSQVAKTTAEIDAEVLALENQIMERVKVRQEIKTATEIKQPMISEITEVTIKDTTGKRI